MPPINPERNSDPLQDLPLSFAEARERFNSKAEGEIPADLRKLLLPELKPYQLQAIDATTTKATNEVFAPMMPRWFGVASQPKVARPTRAARVLMNGKDLQPLLMFAPEDRRTYNDTRYPWGTVCRIITAVGQSSGVIVGPRHVLTASHSIDWAGNSGGTVEVHRVAGSVRATTSISKVWYFTKVSGTVDFFENDEDYALLITRDRIGDLFGWMGTRTYNSSWDGEPWWFNIGYPGSIAGGMRPTFQRDKFLDEPWYDLGPARSMSTNADLTPGNSGGPMFAFWSDGPYVVSVVSSEGSKENWCSGGSWLTTLVSHGRAVDP